MSEQHQIVALDWVKGEIEETLKQSRQSLESFVENPEDATRLRFCLAYLHQVHGTLHMVELYGAALLAEEMEALCLALINQQVGKIDDALELLMRSILQLPTYLDHVRSSRKDVPMILMPLLNDLRSARNEPLLTETTLFKPDLTAVLEEVASLPLNEDMKAVLKKLRQAYQASLVDLLRKDTGNAQAIDHMLLVFDRLARVSSSHGLRQLWEVVGAVIETIHLQGADVSSTMKALLGQTDRQIRRLLDEGQFVPPQDLLRNLLYFVAKAQPGTQRVDAIKARYRLNDALPSEHLLDEDRARLNGPDREAIKSVVDALCEELARVKDTLDLLVRSPSRNVTELEALAPTLKQIADTIGVVGMGQQRKVIIDQISIIEDIVAGGKLDDGRMMDVAGSLLFVEASLHGLVYDRAPSSAPTQGSGADIMEAEQAVLRESRAALEQAKESVVSYISSQWDSSHIQSLPNLLDGVRGGMDMLELHRAGRILFTLAEYVRQKLLFEMGRPDWSDMDTLADVISGVEYYLEHLAHDSRDHLDPLDAAEKAVERLQVYTATVPATDQQESNIHQESIEVQTDASIEPISATDSVLSEEQSAQSQPVTDHLSEHQPYLTADLLPQSEENLNVPESSTRSESEDSVFNNPQVVSSLIMTTTSKPAVPILQEMPQDDFSCDDEIREIFVEEAEEVLENIREYYPQWARDFDKTDALKEFRRGFHTLKGSGRLVGAKVVGELAWAVESMLNRVLDKSITPAPVMLNLMTDVIDLIPGLVEDFQNKIAPRQDTTLLMRTAVALTRGEPIPVAAELEPVTEVVSEVAPEVEEVAAELEPVTEVVSEVAPEVEEVAAELEPVTEVVSEVAPEVEEAAAELEPVTEVVSEVAPEVEEAAAELEPVTEVVSEVAPEVEEVAAELEPVTEVVSEVAPEVEEAAAELEPVTEVVEDIHEAVEPVAELEPLDAYASEGVDQSPQSVEQPAEERSLRRSSSFDAMVESLEHPDHALAEELNALEAQDDAGSVDPVLLEIFVSEARSHLASIKEFLEDSGQHGAVTDGILRALHTLKGSAAMANVSHIASLSSALENLFKNLRNSNCAVQIDHRAVLQDGHDQIDAGVQILEQGGMPSLLDEELLDQIHRLTRELASPVSDHSSESSEEMDTGPVATLLAAGIDRILDAPDDLMNWLKNDNRTALYSDMIEQLGVMQQVSSHLGLEPLVRISGFMGAIYDHLLAGSLQLDQELSKQLLEGHDEIINMLDSLAANLEMVPSDVVLAQLEELAESDELSDQGLLDLFLEEGDELMTEFARLQRDALSGKNHSGLKDIVRIAHTLKGSARLAGIEPVGDLSEVLEHVLDDVLQERLPQSPEVATLVSQAVLGLMQMLSELRERGECAAQDEMVHLLRAMTEIRPSLARVEPATPERSQPESAAEPVSYDSELLEIFLEEADEIMDATARDLQKFLQDPDNLKTIQLLQRSLHTLKGGARLAEISPIGDLAHEMESLFERLADRNIPFMPVLNDMLLSCQDRLTDAVSALRQQQACPAVDDLVSWIRQYLKSPDQALASIPAHSPVELPRVSQPQVMAPVVESMAMPDHEILDFFLEESDEIFAAIEQSLSALLDAPADRQHIGLLLRHLHTLKGGARLAELVEIGDFAHNWESVLETVQESGASPTRSFWQDQLDTLSQLSSLLQRLHRGGAEQAEPFVPLHAEPEVANLPEVELMPAPEPAQRAQELIERAESVLRPDGLGKAIPPAMAVRHLSDAQKAPQEMVRVPAELLERLVNLAGETSIARGRVEQGVLSFQQSLEDMGATIQRLSEQLRRMDTELDAQIKASYSREVEQAKYEDFDPLEMDRYSSLNQLSRSLAESSSDLLDITDTLQEKMRDAETLLLQQSRINTELQEGLMRTRMVTFSRLVPRLRRIVRQTGQEVGKLVDLEVINPEGEMDRSLMERMVAPLEHMLRNAVDHGVEARQKRLALGKPEEGRITLVLAREGSEVVLKLSDDGGGIDVQAVRQKARERGLMLEDADLSDHDVMQFIFHSGFSTAQTVTQISGRGVGMDVVQSEIKQMGGTVDIQSEPGRGTIFTVRLPFTVSVNRALMVRVGDDVYAVPLQQVEGIVRVSTDDLEQYYGAQSNPFHYAGTSYHLHYMGEFVLGKLQPNVTPGQSLPLPVLLVRGGDQRRFALQVDALLGSREVVVKSVGAQLSSVAGISGATILGDGSVVIILDLQALLRSTAFIQGAARRVLDQKQHQEDTTSTPVAEVDHRTRLVMVVDDSVTVRKVMSRLLERHGYDVVVAKDGVDAISQLEDVTPDIMLLDIEMPRMDGFEVASLVRHNARLERMPIVMITSRTGEKHRERAYSIGVDAYMGKPFVEQNLLDTVRELLGSRVNT